MPNFKAGQMIVNIEILQEVENDEKVEDDEDVKTFSNIEEESE